MRVIAQAKKINEKIATICKDRSTVNSSYRIIDESVQAELRLSVDWMIKYPVDVIRFPKNLAGDQNPIWTDIWRIAEAIQRAAKLAEVTREGERYYNILPKTIIPISAKRKNGDQLRADAKAAWEIETGKRFLADYRAAADKRNLAAIRAVITDLQAEQKKLLPQLRAANSAYLAGKKTERAAQALKNAEALKSSRFWEADKDTLKKYFRPPFDKNYLADVSDKWRAALFLECESISYKTSYGNWGHTLGGTGRGYLCGIDDNGDEWGHRVDNLPQTCDGHGNAELDSTVDEAMSELFSISVSALADCQRQGDLLFCSTKIPPAVVLHPQAEPWDVRESHRIESPALERNGRHFRSAEPIKITHTSHAALTLEPGEYRLYTIRIAEAD